MPNEKIRKKPGPIAGPAMTRTNVLIEPELLEWAKQQPGGFSELVRQLIREAKERQERSLQKRGI
jgi:hypothetical protein